MELNINSPLFFKDKYGIDDDVYIFCQQLHQFFKDKEYSDTLKTVGIIPILAPNESYERGEWKERVSMISGNSVATIYIRMNYEEYIDADESDKKRMYKEMIIGAIKKVKGKGKFDHEIFCKDLEVFTNSIL